MISIIICSVKPLLAKDIKENIAATIGVPYELILIDNRNTDNGIASVYNDAALTAKFEILCFLHEDVILFTESWGVELHSILTDEKIGLVGGFGSVYKSKFAGSWAACHPSLYRINSYNNQEKKITNNKQEGYATCTAKYDEVVVIDGAFMATTRKVFKLFQFDDKLLRGFHGYDVDYSIQVAQKFKIIVSNNIRMKHISNGTLNISWLKDNQLVHEKWKRKLPAKVSQEPFNIYRVSDYASLSSVLNVYLKFSGFKYNACKILAIMVFKFIDINRLRYFKSVFKYCIKRNKHDIKTSIE